MKTVVQNGAAEYKKKHRFAKRWYKVVTCMAAVVVFVTTYALILPAITMENKAYCGIEEHQHSEEAGCYEDRLICGMEETEGHTHTEECYEQRQELVCGLEETEPSLGELICGMEENDEHMHTTDCYEQIPGHVHEDSCYAAETVLICGQEEWEGHMHTEACYDRELTCQQQEHAHTLACRSNPDADLENEEDWKKTFKDVKKTGNWEEDLVAVAASQIGYQESTKNYLVREAEDGTEETVGYSRYGAWYGDPYGDWCAMFISFCLRYADADTFPLDCNCQAWRMRFQADQVWMDPASYIPQSGDLIFFDRNGDNVSDHVGIVERYEEKETEADGRTVIERTVHTIEGNTSNLVARREYDPGDTGILGYGSMDAAVEKYRPAEALELTCEGSDYRIQVSVPEAAGFPGNVKMKAEELTGDEYKQSCRDAKEALGIDEIRFARFFDITFYAGRKKLEPKVPVQISIHYTDAVKQTDNQISGAVHFAESGTEVLETGTQNDEAGGTTFTFTQSSFSVTGTVTGVTKDGAEEAEKKPETEPEEDSEEEAEKAPEKEETEKPKKGPAKAPTQNTTELQISKTWSDGNEKHTSNSVTVYLTVNGQRNGQSVTLNAGNNWSASFTNLQVKDSSGKTISYSAEEGEVQGYSSSKAETPGSQTTGGEVWVQASTLEYNKEYVIYYERDGNKYVLREYNGDIYEMAVSVDGNGQITTALDNNNKWIINNSQDENIISVSRTNCPLKLVQSSWKFACDYNNGTNATISMTDSRCWIIANYYGWRYMKNANEVTEQNNATYYSLYEQQTGVTYTPSRVTFTNTPDNQPFTPDSNAPAVGSVTGTQVDTPVIGQWYILYDYTDNDSWQGVALNANNPADTGTILARSSDNKGTVEYTGDADVVWQYTENGFRNRNGQYLTLQYDPTGAKANLNYIQSMNSAIGLSADTTHAGVTYDAERRGLYNEEDVSRRTVLLPLLSTTEHVYNYVHFNGERTPGCRTYLYQYGADQRDGDKKTYIAQVTYSSNSGSGGGTGVLDGKHPLGVVTGDIAAQGIMLYNIDGSDGTAKPLAGVAYTITDANGNVVRRIATTDDFTLALGNLPDGSYSVSQSAVPDGYVVYPQTKSFTVSGGKADQSLLFYDYKAGADGYYSDKTAQVTDYEKRIYQVQINAQSGKYTYDLGNKTFNLVVDQSNSMLFPSNVNEVAEVRIHSDNAGNTHYNFDHAGLDKNKVYYMITDKDHSATQWAIWYSSQKNCWYYQDASYYAKAQKAGGNGNNTNISKANKQPYNVPFADECQGETTKKSDGSYYYGPHPEDNSTGKGYCAFCHGGRLDKTGAFNSLTTSGSGDVYPIYTASKPYNRLHYLQEAMIVLVHQLGSLNQNTKVNLITFDGEVESCLGVTSLDSTGIQTLVNAVNNIKTEGGTRQDRALQHVNGSYGGAERANHTINHAENGKQNEYVILITDGAPVSNESGVSNDKVFQNVTDAAEITRQNATLITVGLSMNDVTGGKNKLKEIADSGGSGIDGKWFYAPDDSSQLANILIEKILAQINTRTLTTTATTVRDYISDSFYLVDEEGNPLKEGDEIHMGGALCKGDKGEHPNWVGPNGIVHHDETGWYVEWQNATLKPKGADNQWYAKLNLKAKEDFIGGNVIDTNKSATITLQQDETGPKDGDTPIELPTPTVNVKLLDMFSYSAEATVFLGDKINEDRDNNGIPDVAEQLWSHVEFNKLITSPAINDAGQETVYNKSGKTEADGVKSETFNLKYAIGDLTPERWNHLKADLESNGKGIKIDYSYDDGSSHGAVGYFTIKLQERNHPGEGDWDVDHLTEGDKNVGYHTYIDDLIITYTPYEMGQTDLTGTARPGQNVHNFVNGPGTEVKETLKETQDEEYDINVIDGKILVDKVIDQSLVKTEEQTYQFELYMLPENVSKFPEEINSTNAVQVGETVSVTIPAGQTKAAVSGIFEHLKRGVYILKEVTGEGYKSKELTIVTDGTAPTNSKAVTAEGSLIFHIGYTTQDEDIIEHYSTPEIDETNHHIVYSRLKAGFTVDSGNENSYHGVSVGHGIVTNTITTKEVKIPVEKRWNPAGESHSSETVYLALCDSTGSALPYDDGTHVVQLNEDNEWKAEFTLQLSFRETLDLTKYTIREVSGVTDQNKELHTQAAVVNVKDENGNNRKIYYQSLAAEDAIVAVGSTEYLVRYTETNGTLIATNYNLYQLPETGGTGTTRYIISGLILMISCMILRYIMRRRSEGRVR